MGRSGTTFLFALLSLGLTGCFDISSDTQALRNVLTKSATAEFDPQFEIGVGSLTLNFARAGFAFVDLDPEARAALDAVRSVDLGVYHLRRQRQRPDRARLLGAADEVMVAHGWDRVVSVVNQRGLVAIYLPQKLISTRNVKFCLIVLDREKLVVCSARSNLEPLWQMALSHSNGRVPLQL